MGKQPSLLGNRSEVALEYSRTGKKLDIVV